MVFKLGVDRTSVSVLKYIFKGFFSRMIPFRHHRTFVTVFWLKSWFFHFFFYQGPRQVVFPGSRCDERAVTKINKK